MANRERVAKAWWEVAARTKSGKKMMPTVNDHKNLLGSKEKYLDATMEVIVEIISLIVDEDAELPMHYWAWCYQLKNGEITASQLAEYIKAAGWRKIREN